MRLSHPNIHNAGQVLDIEVLVKNDRVVVCKIAGVRSGPFYLHYHAATGWKDLDHGDTAFSRQLPGIISNPFELA